LRFACPAGKEIIIEVEIYDFIDLPLVIAKIEEKVLLLKVFEFLLYNMDFITLYYSFRI